MGTITLPNFRVTADVTMNTRLKDGGVYIDWAGLSNIKAWLYSDAQKAIAGRCDVSIDQTDSTKLVCEYSATKPQYLGVNRLIVQGEYMGRTKTYDKPVFNFVRWTDDQAGEEITIDDPIVDVEISVEDVSSSLIERLIAACIKATEEAQEVVDASRGPRGYSAYEIAVELGYEGTEEQWIASLKGEDGEPGTTPHIGQNGNWFIGDTDTGVLARGTNGVTPHIGDNGHWFIGETDTGILAEGTDGVTPHIGQNGHWYIGDVDTEVIAEGHDGEDGQDGVGFDDATTPVVTDGTFIIILSNGDRVTVDLNHEHPQYYSKLVETSQPQGGFLPDVIYKLGTITGSVTFALAAAVTGNANHYYFVFDTGSTAPTITWPAGLTWADGSAPTVAASKHYEVSIMDGIAYYSEV